ncbi:hypothetical protein [Desulfosporosinus sp. OT]|uniref:hypothetical protein n=1 Tax=Desulfosporosinus sp. OT TaxID=913865 RepID=UPI000223A64F|nr:hypothetical protein [Desulfosporosinus sp. OT]EGW37755.1 hypothetical protein DOT_4148 [Desulfosporosinus sp. OT]
MLYLISPQTKFVGAFTAGYFLTMLIYKIIGRPSEPVSYVLYGLILLAVLALEFFAFFFIIRHAQQGKEHDWLHDSFFKVASDAMSRIACGDFRRRFCLNCRGIL